ncbi:hypothetical protein HGRIS_005548 [Hohenbuehelia grisea]|uniref:Uncharacterized protein n=1 Tax=Hohenbuehelia grisea TaxID=104357 RepID=A0ABR3JYM6_9AGAR
MEVRVEEVSEAADLSHKSAKGLKEAMRKAGRKHDTYSGKLRPIHSTAQAS